MFLVSSCSCLCPLHWSQLYSRERRCSRSSADGRWSDYIWSTILLLLRCLYFYGFTVCIYSPIPNLQRRYSWAACQVRAWRSNYIPHETVNTITYPWRDQSIYFEKGHQAIRQQQLWNVWEHDDVIKWKHFPRYSSFVRGNHRSSVDSPHKGHRCGALMFSLIWARINGWTNNRDAGEFRRHRTHYDVTVMMDILNVNSLKDGDANMRQWTESPLVPDRR